MAYFDPYATLKKTLFFIFLNTVPFLITIPLYEIYAYLSYLVLIPVFGLINFLVSDKWWQSFLRTGVMTLFSGIGLFFSLALSAGEGNLSGFHLLFTENFDYSTRLFLAVFGEVLIWTLLAAPLVRLLMLWIRKRRNNK